MLPSNLKDYTMVSQHLVMNEHLNPNLRIFGGTLTAWLDKDLYMYVARELSYKKFATLTMEKIHFRSPANLGEFLQIYGKLKQVGNSSVTVYGVVLAFDPEIDLYREIIACEITYVALDESGKPAKILQERLKRRIESPPAIG